MSSPVQLAKYDNSWYTPGGSLLKRAAWYFLGQPLLRASWIPSSAMRVSLLRMFGASIGKGVVIKPSVDVKYPWHLFIGDDCWIGERAWIDNLTTVRLGSNVCVSQGAYFCTGNHDWTDPHFGLRVAPIELGAGSWVGAKSLLAPGVVLGEGAIVAAGSVVSRPVPAFEIHAGNPACFVKTRILKIRSAAEARECFVDASVDAEISSYPSAADEYGKDPDSPCTLNHSHDSSAANSDGEMSQNSIEDSVHALQPREARAH